MKLTATIKSHKTSLIATLNPATIAQAKLNLYELAQANGFTGSFDDFLAQFKVFDVNTIISQDDGNKLSTGSDGLLYTNPLPDELNVDFMALIDATLHTGL